MLLPTWPERLLLATGNARKAAELRSIIAPRLPSGSVLLSLRDVPGLAEPPDDLESRRTFTGNARAKAAWYAEAAGMACLADDSGLCVDALGGAPGVRSARWAGPGDADRNAHLLAALAACGALTPEQRRAHFTCAVALHAPAQEPWRAVTALGRMDGVILAEPRGQGGLGYDPLFLVPSLGRAAAELGAEEKHAVSHRGKALALLLSVLPSRPSR